jgi:hypothetical protein
MTASLLQSEVDTLLAVCRQFENDDCSFEGMWAAESRFNAAISRAYDDLGTETVNTIAAKVFAHYGN